MVFTLSLHIKLYELHILYIMSRIFRITLNESDDPIMIMMMLMCIIPNSLDPQQSGNSWHHKVLNDLERTMLSRGRIFWLRTHPIPSPLPSVSATGDTQED
jgi:hypothetical protein